MRLLTHNYLQSNVRGTTNGYPLKIEATKVVLEESNLDQELLLRLLPKLDYTALLAAWEQVAPHVPQAAEWELPATLPDPLDSILQQPPQPQPPTDNNNEQQQQQSNDGSSSTNKSRPIDALHRVLFDVHIIEGQLVCPDTGRKFPIKEGIPNMILHEDEL